MRKWLYKGPILGRRDQNEGLVLGGTGFRKERLNMRMTDSRKDWF